MKKYALSAFLSLLLVSNALAATVNMNGGSFEENELGEFEVLSITAQAEGEITAQHGIRLLLLSEETPVLWNDSQLRLSGSAVQNGRMEPVLQPEFSDDYKMLHLPVTENFAAGEELVIQDLTLRTYWQSFSYRNLGIDLNGDMTADLEYQNAFRVEDESNSDKIAPYSVANLTHEKLGVSSIHLTWNNPPDYDFENVLINRSINDGGLEQLYFGRGQEFTDSSLPAEGSVAYFVSTKDLYNFSDPLKFVITLGQPQEEESAVDDEPGAGAGNESPVDQPDSDEETPSEENQAASQQELDQLAKMLNYYKIRHQIRCLPNGVAAYWGDGFCLWAKIDLAYAQEKLGLSDVAVSFTDQQKTVIESRLGFSVTRYQTHCVQAATPAAYCTALSKALMRAEYFLDQWSESQ